MFVAPHALTSRAFGWFPTKAGLQTFLHLEAPSRPNGQWLSASGHNGVHCCGTVGDSHSSSQLSTAKCTFTGDSFQNHAAKLQKIHHPPCIIHNFFPPSSKFFTFHYSLFTFFRIFAPKKWQSGGCRRHDVRESGESPGLFLQL